MTRADHPSRLRASQTLGLGIPEWRLGLAALAREPRPGSAPGSRAEDPPPGRGAIAAAVARAPRSSKRARASRSLPPTSSRSPIRAPPTGRCFALALDDPPALRATSPAPPCPARADGADLAELGLAGVAARRRDPRGAPPPQARRRARRPRRRARGRAGADRRVIRWDDAPGPYEVVFSTREGGVSEGPFASLNLGRATADEPERVDENRRRLCAEVGADPEALDAELPTPLDRRAACAGRLPRRARRRPLDGRARPAAARARG